MAANKIKVTVMISKLRRELEPEEEIYLINSTGKLGTIYFLRARVVPQNKLNFRQRIVW